jgi:2-haloacid dehalogenase
VQQESAARGVDAVVFDLGGVLIDWNPRYLYRALFDDNEEMETFLRDVCSPSWIAGVDAGRPFGDAIRDLAAEHPSQRELIEAFRARWEEMLGKEIIGSVRIVEELHDVGIPLFALSNWSAETFPIARERYLFLQLFDGILISGDAGHAKPAPGIFDVFLQRFGLTAHRCIFVDDRAENLRAAAKMGFDTVEFESPEQLGKKLAARGLLGHPSQLDVPITPAGQRH